MTICPEEHKHEKSSICHDKHKCRCQWCVSEYRVRQQKRGRNLALSPLEVIEEFEFLSSQGLTWDEVRATLNYSSEKAQFKKVLIREKREDLIPILYKSD